MSVQPAGSSAPAFTVPFADALNAGSPPAHASGAATNAPSSYAQSYANLQVADAAELIQVSQESPAAAQANVASVLQQAAAYQEQAAAARQSAILSAAENVPSLGAVLAQTIDTTA